MTQLISRSREAREAIEAQAAYFLASSVNKPDRATCLTIERWIASDPRHAVAFAQAEILWEATERLKGQDIAAQPVERSEFRPSAVFTRRRVIAGGTVAAAAFGAATFAWVSRAILYSTTVGGSQDVALADGSLVHLNTDSQLQVALTADYRRLVLTRGEAFFDVARDPTRPFDVEVPGGVVRAIGTAFNIRLRGAIVELTVTHGVVGVRSEEGVMRRVPAGESAVIQPKTVAVGQIDQKLISKRVAWRERVILLNGDTVGEAVEEFNRYRSAPILIGDQRIAALRVGGRFKTNESAEFVQALEQTLPISSVNDSDGSVLLVYANQKI